MSKGRWLYPDLEARLIGNSYEYEGHWLWTGAVNSDGYPKIQIWDSVVKRSIAVYAHRVSYATFIGPIPEGHDIDHLTRCPYRHCIHPNCLRPLPYKEHRALTGFKMGRKPQSLRLNHAKT